MLQYTAEFIERFWSKVHKTDKCWLWTGKPAKAGYGQIQCRSISRIPMYSHRVSWELANGEIPGDLHVLHECDIRLCVRPDHLFLGTQVDNNNDRHNKGRTASGDKNGSRTRPDRNPFVANGGNGLIGEKHPAACLSDSDVQDILTMAEVSGSPRGFKAMLAREFQVSQSQIGRIISGKSRKKRP